MARKSKNSKMDLMESSVLIPSARKPASTQSLQDQLIETKLRIEQAKLAKLEVDAEDKNPKYTRYEDMPPPTPEDEARFYARFQELVRAIATQPDEEE